MTKRFLIAFAVLMTLAYLPQAIKAQSGSSFTAPRAGFWRVTGKDADGVIWGERFRITKRQLAGNIVKLSGYFDWRSADKTTEGREYVRGSFERSSGRLTLAGYAVKNRRGEIAKTRYVAYVSRQGRLISRGRWSGKDVVTGTWKANWLK